MADRPSDFTVSTVLAAQVSAAAAPATSAPTRTIYSVSKLNREVRLLLESGVGQVWVQGEISNLARPSSGHWYFSLKDRDAQLRCAMFRARNGLCRFTPREGQAVIAYGRVSLYEPRGDYQLLIEHLDDAGLGALQRSFDELKARLAAEGLFATERKRALPLVPRRIGVITSPTGAAIRDVLHILARRFPAAAVLVYPVPVQGAAAAPAIVAALDLASARAECDVLILTRGGGGRNLLQSVLFTLASARALGARQRGVCRAGQQGPRQRPHRFTDRPADHRDPGGRRHGIRSDQRDFDHRRADLHGIRSVQRRYPAGDERRHLGVARRWRGADRYHQAARRRHSPVAGAVPRGPGVLASRRGTRRRPPAST